MLYIKVYGLFELGYQLDVDEPYKFEQYAGFCRIRGTFKEDLPFTSFVSTTESLQSLEARIAKLKHNNVFNKEFNELINDKD